MSFQNQDQDSPSDSEQTLLEHGSTDDHFQKHFVIDHLFNILQVTVLIYSDLLLFTREDEAGRCNVLQSPLYLNTLQLREGTRTTLFFCLLTSCFYDCFLSSQTRY